MSFVDFAGGKINVGKTLVGREANRLHGIGDGESLVLGHFSFHQSDIDAL